mmetsp:Transcript_10513/g.29911  ORF Transcript_10513/g.29911 Transcript_10513/m.29911 type:complete len:594 (+) Transcript_10513:84-1865(+)
MSQAMKSSTLSMGRAPGQPRSQSGPVSRGSRKQHSGIHRAWPMRAGKVEVDMETSGLRAGLSEEAKDRILNGKINPQEKMKLAKCGTTSWTEIYELADLLRKGESTWEELNVDDLDHRAKWNGIFHRRKKTPGQCMIRFRVPGQVLTSEQMRAFGECIETYGEAGDEVPSTKGCGDITTRANIQLRGIPVEDTVVIMDKMMALGITAKQSGMDNVRNITGSPIAGIDPHELIDPTQLCIDLQNMITDFGKGNMDLSNLPRKFNIAISPSRDDFPHCHINDLAFQAINNPAGETVFNVWLGGLFSAQRNEVSVNGQMSVTAEQIVPFSKALLELFRDNGKREVRQKTRLMYMIDEWGVEKLKAEIEAKIGESIAPAVPEEFDEHWERRDVLGVHKQKQEGFSWVGLSVPVGRLSSSDFKDLAALAENYGNSTLRVTVDENVIIPFVKHEDVDALMAEPICQKFSPVPGPLERGLVSCTGSQFCGFALVETKMRAIRLARLLEAELDIPKPVRIHWTGCPNSCGQAQVGDIGLMGAPAKLDGKAVEGVKVFLGGTIGEEAKLAALVDKTAVPAADEYLVPYLKTLLIEKFGASPK